MRSTLFVQVSSMLYDFLKVTLAPLIWACYRMEIKGAENIPDDGAVIIASNHVSNLDPLLLGAAVPRRLHFMAKEELFKNPILGWVCRTLGAFPVRRGASDRNAIKKAFDILRDGKMLAIFPEGTRSKDGVLRQLAPGTMLIAAKSDATLVPVAIKGHASWCNPFPKITIRFGQPITIKPEHQTKEGMAKLTQRLSDDLARLLYRSRW